jgi:hypothetical protein
LISFCDIKALFNLLFNFAVLQSFTTSNFLRQPQLIASVRMYLLFSYAFYCNKLACTPRLQAAIIAVIVTVTITVGLYWHLSLCLCADNAHWAMWEKIHHLAL